MGDSDPDIARDETSNSLRALYGISTEQNAVMGSPDVHIAEIQIQSIFASSPPFPTGDLPDVSNGPYAADSRYETSYFQPGQDSPQRTSLDRSVSSGTGSAGKQNGSSGSGSEKVKFRARPLPSTHVAPDIVPRMSRAADLRAGLVIDSSPKRYPATPESVARTFAGVPGHKRAEPIAVASTAPPVVPPRMTRAAVLRIGQPVPVKQKPRQSTDAAPQDIFDGIPGHKRREIIIVASTKPPSVAPRTNRSAALRVTKDAAPPVSYNCKCMLHHRVGETVNNLSSPRALKFRSICLQELPRPVRYRSAHYCSSCVRFRPSARQNKLTAYPYDAARWFRRGQQAVSHHGRHGAVDCAEAPVPSEQHPYPSHHHSSHEQKRAVACGADVVSRWRSEVVPGQVSWQEVPCCRDSEAYPRLVGLQLELLVHLIPSFSSHRACRCAVRVVFGSPAGVSIFYIYSTITQVDIRFPLSSCAFLSPCYFMRYPYHNYPLLLWFR